MSEIWIDPTSKLTAALRAKESLRPNRLYVDAYAEHLTDDQGRELLSEIEALHPEPGSQPCTVNYNAIRTRVFDDYLVSAIERHGIEQLVLPAAGLDTRAYRLNFPERVTVFELDRENVLEHKDRVLRARGARPRCSVRGIGVDLTASWKDRLLAAGYDPARPSLWLLEGLLYYWREPDVRALLAAIQSLTTPGSLIAADLVNAQALSARDPVAIALTEIFARWGCAWSYGCDEPEALWREYGMLADVLEPGDDAANFGRWSLRMPPRDVPKVPRAFLVFGRRV